MEKRNWHYSQWSHPNKTKMMQFWGQNSLHAFASVINTFLIDEVFSENKLSNWEQSHLLHPFTDCTSPADISLQTISFIRHSSTPKSIIQFNRVIGRICSTIVTIEIARSWLLYKILLSIPTHAKLLLHSSLYKKILKSGIDCTAFTVQSDVCCTDCAVHGGVVDF